MAYRLAHPDNVFDLAIAHNEMSYYYNEQGRYRYAIDHGLKALAAYQHMDMYRTEEALALNPRLNIAHAHYWLGEVAEAESYALLCLKWIEKNQYEWDFNANR
jgi:tetratricopeptide (TPR) repeat protein